MFKIDGIKHSYLTKIDNMFEVPTHDGIGATYGRQRDVKGIGPTPRAHDAAIQVGLRQSISFVRVREDNLVLLGEPLDPRPYLRRAVIFLTGS